MTQPNCNGFGKSWQIHKRKTNRCAVSWRGHRRSLRKSRRREKRNRRRPSHRKRSPSQVTWWPASIHSRSNCARNSERTSMQKEHPSMIIGLEGFGSVWSTRAGASARADGFLQHNRHRSWTDGYAIVLGSLAKSASTRSVDSIRSTSKQISAESLNRPGFRTDRTRACSCTTC